MNAPKLSPYVTEFVVDLARDFEPGETQRLLESLLVRLVRGCLKEGAQVIGHIKFSGTDETGGSFSGSITSIDAGPRVEAATRSSHRQLCLKLAVLVYGLPRAALARITKGVWETLVASGQVQYIVEKEEQLDDKKAPV